PKVSRDALKMDRRAGSYRACRIHSVAKVRINMYAGRPRMPDTVNRIASFGHTVTKPLNKVAAKKTMTPSAKFHAARRVAASSVDSPGWPLSHRSIASPAGTDA